VTGDVAWGGNWFFITENAPCELELANLDRLIDYTWRVRQALARNGVTGANAGEIDHIELSGAPRSAGADSRNFVLCPGKEYDRSPCGTGTSAKVACLHADGKLGEGSVWRQESIIGTVFEASFAMREGKVYPHVKGSAFITAETNLVMQDDDPFCWGIRV
jgi:4-hydroxyproline epimerase